MSRRRGQKHVVPHPEYFLPGMRSRQITVFFLQNREWTVAEPPLLIVYGKWLIISKKPWFTGIQAGFQAEFTTNLLLLRERALICRPEPCQPSHQHTALRKNKWKLNTTQMRRFSTGLFAIFIHPVTFYYSPFFLNMSILFYWLAKIIPITDIPFFCKLLLSSVSSVILYCITA